jgi:hypothetical protein
VKVCSHFLVFCRLSLTRHLSHSKVSLRYGVGEGARAALDEELAAAAVREMQEVPFEFAFVARRDCPKADVEAEVEAAGGDGAGGSTLVRDLVITSARGVRRYRVWV